MALDVQAIKKDFPIFEDREQPLVFLDSAASSQKPRAVLDAMTDYYERSHANVHRGVYALAEEATARYEGARSRVAASIDATCRLITRGAAPIGWSPWHPTATSCSRPPTRGRRRTR